MSVRLFWSLFTACAVLAGAAPAAGAATFTVTTAADERGVCDSTCSLAEAITAANDTPGADTIAFAVPDPAPVTITPLTQLPDVTEAVLIDGTTQPGYGIYASDTYAPAVEVDGTLASAAGGADGADGLRVRGGDSTVRGLAINRFTGTAAGAQIRILDGNRVHVEGSRLGTDPSGQIALGGAAGVVVSASANVAADNVIGGTAPGAGNVISGNGSVGIRADASVTVLGNTIGLNAAGDAALGNGVAGIEARANGQIGDGTPAGRNVISGNGSSPGNGFGIHVTAASYGMYVAGNFIGTDVTGRHPAANTSVGLYVDGSQYTTTSGNVISAHPDAQVWISGSTTSRAEINGDLIGTDVDGQGRVGPNPSAVGVRLDQGASDNDVRNTVIAGQGTGILVADDAPGNRLQANRVGITAGGAVLGNSGDGILVHASNTFVGYQDGNLVRGSGGAGIRVTATAVGAPDPQNVTLFGNQVDGNVGLGIDLGPDGVNPNDPGDGDGGVNQGLNFPVIQTVSSGGGTTTVTGTLDAPAGTYYIDVFASPTCDVPSGNGEGRRYLGSEFVSNGNFTATAYYGEPAAGEVVTLTATAYTGSGWGGTSEFSTCASAGTALNGPPVAVRDRMGGGGPLNVLANDSDPDFDPLTLISWTQPEVGTASCTPAGICTTTIADYDWCNAPPTGGTSFTYTVSDGRGGTAVGLVTQIYVFVCDGDTTPPETSIDIGPTGTVGSNSASFAFSSEAGATFECRLDDGPWDSCSSPKAYPNLADGSHTVEVRATDAAGNTDQTPASRTWMVDTAPPETSIDSGPSGAVGTAGATVGFSSEAGATFECRMDGGAWSACTSPKDYPGLADGSYTFEVRATDAAGNTDPTPASRTWSVDTSPPDTRIDSGPSGTVSSAAAVFAFSSEVGAGFECRLDGGPWDSCSSPKTYTGLADGSHAFQVRATDTAGNTDPTPASSAWTIDGAPPETTIDSGPPALTSATSTSLGFSSEAGATFECRLDGGGWGTCSSPTAYTALAAGSHTFEVRATDAAGNTDPTPASRTWSIDTVPPETVIDSGPSGLVNTTAATFAFSSEPGVLFFCRLDGGFEWPCSSPYSVFALPEGPHTFEVRAMDGAGNYDPTPASRAWTIDATPPDTTITSGPSGLVNTRSAAFGFSSEAGAPFECRLDAGTWGACTSPKAYASLAEGSHTFEVRAKDAAGNTDPTPASRTWVVDTLAPTELRVTPSPPLNPRSTSATFVFDTTEPNPVFYCSLNGGPSTVCSSPYTVSGLADGPQVLSVRVADPAGNLGATVAFPWTVDTTAPDTTITAGPTGTVSSAGASFTFSASEAGSSFVCRLDAGAWGPCASPKTYSALGEGSHTVDVRATDPAGNVDATPASRTWTVDTTAPDTTITSGPSGTVTSSSASFDFTSEAGATFACRLDGGAWASCTSPKAYAALADGVHTFDVRATDPAGNVDVTPASRSWTIATSGGVVLPTLDPPAAAKVAAWSWGQNLSGALGTGTTNSRLFAGEILGLSNVAALAAGQYHSLALRLDGTVLAWGSGSGSTPAPVSGLTNIIAIAAGAYHSLAVRSDGTVLAWGSNDTGQLGDGTTTDRSTPVPVAGLTNVIAVSAGRAHNLALRSDGTVRAWGANRNGELGDGTGTDQLAPVTVSGLTNITAIDAGWSYSLALRSDGTVRAFGSGGSGQLGDGTTTSRLTPVTVGGMTDATAISAGDSTSVALRSDGTAAAWGYNGDGELGDGTTTSRLTPATVGGVTSVTAISTGYDHSLALRSDGTVVAWGYNGDGQLGDGTTVNRLTPVMVGGLTDVTAIAAGGYHSLASGTASPTLGVKSFTKALPAGATVTTDVELDGATPDSPVETTITTPNAGTVSVVEAPSQGSSGFGFAGRSVQITAPAATAANPLIFRFRLDSSVFPLSWSSSALSVYRNGALVSNCTGAGATPNPCVETRTRLADGDVEIVVRTSAASQWLVGRTGPKANAGGPYTVAEGSSIKFQGSATGGQGPYTYRWLAAAQLNDPTKASPTFTALDDGTLRLDLEVRDAAGLAGQASTKVTVTNRPPAISSVAISRNSGRRLGVAATFADPGRSDTHDASVQWGDGTQSAAPVSEGNGAGVATSSHQYARTGTYRVKIIVRDDDGGSTSVEKNIQI